MEPPQEQAPFNDHTVILMNFSVSPRNPALSHRAKQFAKAKCERDREHRFTKIPGLREQGLTPRNGPFPSIFTYDEVIPPDFKWLSL